MEYMGCNRKEERSRHSLELSLINCPRFPPLAKQEVKLSDPEGAVVTPVFDT